jgi:hypothetical protein
VKHTALAGLVAGVVLGVAGTGFTSSTWAQQESKRKSQAVQDAMQAMLKAATPGPEHALIGQFAGTWTATVESFDPSTRAMVTSQGTMTNTAVLGGRWLRQEFRGEFGGMPFEGIGHWGYDILRKQYVGVWMDNFTTGCLVSYGSYDEATKTWTLTGKMPDPVTGKDTTMREVMTVKSPTEYVSEAWVPGPDGKEVKMMTIVYTKN